MPTIQLRWYTIKAGKMAEFVAGWTNGVRPLRLRHGFTIPGAWVLEERNQFLWLLAYDGPRDAFEEKDARYYASQERKSLKPDPAPLIEKAETWFVAQAVP